MSRQKRVRKLINLDIKTEIISKQESGKNVGDLSAEYGMAKSTTTTIIIIISCYPFRDIGRQQNVAI
jgi:hypothetical protein